jgi:hypothetical protein
MAAPSRALALAAAGLAGAPPPVPTAAASAAAVGVLSPGSADLAVDHFRDDTRALRVLAAGGDGAPEHVSGRYVRRARVVAGAARRRGSSSSLVTVAAPATVTSYLVDPATRRVVAQGVVVRATGARARVAPECGACAAGA